MIIFTKRLTPPVVRCSDRYGFVLLTDITLLSGDDSDKGWHNAVADGASPARSLEYHYFTKTWLCHVLADEALTGRSTAYHYFHKATGGSARGGASWRGAACYTAVADIRKKLCRRADRFGTESSPHAKQSLLRTLSQTRQRSSQTMENRVG